MASKTEAEQWQAMIFHGSKGIFKGLPSRKETRVAHFSWPEVLNWEAARLLGFSRDDARLATAAKVPLGAPKTAEAIPKPPVLRQKHPKSG